MRFITSTLLVLSLLSASCAPRPFAPAAPKVTESIPAPPVRRMADAPKGWYVIKKDECSFALPVQVREIKEERKKGDPSFTGRTKDNKFMFAFNQESGFATLKRLSESVQAEFEDRDAEISQTMHTEIDETDALAIVAVSDQLTMIAFLVVKNRVGYTMLCGTAEDTESSIQTMAEACESIAKTMIFAKQ